MSPETAASTTREEGRGPQESTFITNTINCELNASILLAKLLNSNGLGVEVRPEAVDGGDDLSKIVCQFTAIPRRQEILT